MAKRSSEELVQPLPRDENDVPDWQPLFDAVAELPIERRLDQDFRAAIADLPELEDWYAYSRAAGKAEPMALVFVWHDDRPPVVLLRRRLDGGQQRRVLEAAHDALGGNERYQWSTFDDARVTVLGVRS